MGKSTPRKLILGLILLFLYTILFMTCEEDSNPIVRTPETGTILGTVKDNISQLPIFGAVVRAINNQIADTTDRFGDFQIENLSLGEETLIVAAPGYQNQCNVVEVTADMQEVNFSLNTKQAQAGYYLYAGNMARPKVYLVDTQNNTISDTFSEFAPDVLNLALSKSGNKLYVSTSEGLVNSPGRLYVVELETGLTRLIHQKSNDIYISPNGTVFIFSYEPRTNISNIGIVEPYSGTISFFDTLDIRKTGYDDLSVLFHPTQPLLYAVNSSKQLFAYDYLQKQIVHIYENIYDPYHMVISHDGRFLYESGGVVFDLESDSVIAGIGGNPLGSLALSPDGEYLYITDPGKYLIPEPVPSGKISIFSTSSFSIVGEIDVNGISGYAYTLTDRIVITPDGKNAYVNDYAYNIYVLDLNAWVATGVISFPPRNLMLRPMVLGPKLIN